MPKVNALLRLLALLLGSVLSCFAQTPISVGETKTGTLEASDSRREDCNGCIADRYEFIISSSQALVITLNSTDFDAFLRVRDGSSGAEVATDDESGGGGNALISRTFAAGTYEIQASTFSEGETGGYTLSLQAVPPPTLISVGQTLNRTLVASDGRSVGCSGCFADRYEFSINSSQALVIRLDSTDFDAFLRVLDSTGSELVTDDDSGGGTNSVISRIFQAGTYRIEATSFSEDQQGAYTLSLQEVPVTMISVGETVSGTLNSADGRSVGCAECFTDLYEFNISSSQDLAIGLDSMDFDAFLRVLDSSGMVVASDDDSGGGTNARTLSTFEAGTYRIEATTFSEDEAGAYTVSLEEAPEPTVTPISVGLTVSGALNFSDGRSMRCSGCFADQHEFSLSSSQDLAIGLDSTDFDAFLRVLDSSGVVVATDDDSGGGTNARILSTFEAGTYRIEATTFSEDEAGAYTVSLEEAPAPTITPIGVGQTVSGTLNFLDGRSVRCSGCFADQHEFSISSPQALVIRLDSTDFDALLLVLDSSGVVVATDDDSGGGTNARISRTFGAGTYRIEATTFSEDEAGAYTVSLEEVPPPTVTHISVGQTVSGTLTSSDSTSVSCSDCFADLYDFSLGSSQELTISLDSIDFDALLRVLNSSGVVVATDDDGGGDTNSRIARTFAAGTYRIETTSYSEDETGAYTLSLTVGMAAPAPSMTSLSPASTSAGGPDFDLTVGGANFAASSAVRWNGSDRPTTLIDSTELRATISTTDIAQPTTALVTVFTPIGGTSNALEFSVITAAAQLEVAPEFLNFEATEAGPSTPAKTLSITNLGSGTLEWSTTVQTSGGGQWLSVSPASGTAPSSVTVVVDPSNLSAGVYSGLVTVQGAGDSKEVVATFLVTRPVSILRPTQTGFLFEGTEGALSVPAQTIQMLNAGQGTMNWTVQAEAGDGGNWLSVTPTSGTSQGGVSVGAPTTTIQVDPSGLKAGTHVGLLTFEAPGAPNSPLSGIVLVNVFPPSGEALGVVQPSGLIFLGVAGSASPSAKQISLTSTGGKQLLYEATASTADGGNWLTVKPSSGSLSRASEVVALSAQANTTGLAAGIHTATVSVALSTGRRLDASVVLVLATPGTVLNASAAQTLPARADAGWDGAAQECQATEVAIVETLASGNFALSVGFPRALLTQVVDDCGQQVTNATVIATFSTGDPTLVLNNHGDGLYSNTWVPSREASSVVVTLQAGAPGLPEARVQLRGKVQQAGGPLVFPNGAVNGASFAKGAPLAPGSIFSVFGRNLPRSAMVATQVPLPLDLNDVRVTLGGKEVPLFFVGAGGSGFEQINAQVPFDLAPGTTPSLLVAVRGRTAPPEQVILAAVQPGIFDVGGGQGAVLIANTDILVAPVGSIPGRQTRPADRGEFVSIFCTGLGATSPTVPAGETGGGQPVTTPVTATLGGVNAPVTFAGLAPGFVGLYQVNVQVPEGVAANDAVSLVITQAEVSSNTVTIAVE